MKRSLNMQALLVGLTFFAALFGAGNLIFPSYLGLQSGKSLTAFVMFFVMDVVFACLGILAESKRPDVNMSTLGRIGKPIFYFMTVFIMLLGLVATMPRTAAVSFEIGIKPLLPSLPPVVYSFIYFVLVFICMVKPGKVVDNVGKYLTPILIAGIIAIIIKGLITPLGTIADTPQIEGLFKEGVIQGYQTMDGMSGPSFAMVFIASILANGFKEKRDMEKILVRSCFVTIFFMAIIYGGLFYLGACLSNEFAPGDVSQAGLVSIIVERLLGKAGLALFAVVVFLACLTTAISSTASVAQLWGMVSNGRIKYEWCGVVYCACGVFLSILGVDAILAIAAPFLQIIFPPYIILIILTLFTNYIKNDNVFIFAAVASMVFSAFSLLDVPVLGSLPGQDYLLGWVIPTLICALIGNLVPSKKHRDPVHAANIAGAAKEALPDVCGDETSEAVSEYEEGNGKTE